MFPERCTQCLVYCVNMGNIWHLSFLIVFVTSLLQHGDGQTANPDNKLVKTTSPSKIVRFYGNSFIVYDINTNTLPAEYSATILNESLSMKFYTQDSDGILLVLKGSNGLIMQISTKDGGIVFVVDDGKSSSQTMRVQSSDAHPLNNAAWHSLKIKKEGITLKFYVDDKYVTQMTTTIEVQFLQNGTLYLGGIAKSVLNTARDGFKGDLTEVEIIRVMGPNKQLHVSFLEHVSSADTRNIDVINKEEWSSQTQNWSKPPPEEPITFTSGSSVLILNETLNMRSGGSLSFDFQTLEPHGLLVLAQASAQSSNFFFAIEISDGNLYFIYNLGTISGRKHFPSRVDNGEWHEVRMTVDGSEIVLSADGSLLKTTLTRDEMLKMYFYRLLLGGSDDFARVPWALYSRQGYKGCFRLLKINNNGLELTNSNIIQITRGIERGCRSTTLFCREQPCLTGNCKDRMDGYVCDCANTPYSGKNCSTAAITAAWDGTLSTTYHLANREVTHRNDISIRFMTPLADTLLFKTEADDKEDYIHAQLDEGRAKVTVKVDGKIRTSVTGSNLNDYSWHTLYIRRRGDDMTIWVDNESVITGVIGGKDYQLYIDRIKLGSVGRTGTSSENNYIGYMQNFMFSNNDLLSLMKTQNMKINWITSMPSDDLTQLIYTPITITASTAYLQLPALQIGDTMKIHFKFKTLESNGLILYNGGTGNDTIAIELINGKIRLVYNLGGQNAFKVVPTTNRLNDNQWHSVQVGLNERGQFSVKVDDTNVHVTASGSDGQLSLNGNLYIGGVPQSMYNSQALSGLIESRMGFRGCLASVDLNGDVPKLTKYASGIPEVLTGCNELVMVCKPNTCGLGLCLPSGTGFYCDCNMTGYIGATCTDNPEGYYFGKNGGKGIMIYEFPFEKQTSTNTDELAFGFMTEQSDAVLYRIEGNKDSGEYIEIRLENGYIVADSNTGSGLISISEHAQRFNDGQYHTLRYIRSGRNSTLQVDKLPVQVITHTGTLSVFDNVYAVLLGGKRDARDNQIMNFNGIIGGVYYNGHRWLEQKPLYGKLIQMKGDIVLAKPFLLITAGGATTPAPPDILIPPNGEVPVDIGGGGIIGSGIGGSGGGAQSEFLGIGGLGGLTGITGGIGVNVPGEPVPLAAASIGLASPSLGAGARAGAVVGTVLGTLAFLTSLMWALYQLKPGVPTCLSPGASAVGSGKAGMSISSPQVASTIGTVKAVSAAGSASGAGEGAGVSKVTVVNGSASGGAGAGGGGSAYTSYIQSSSAAVAGGGSGGGTNVVAGGADIIDASTLQPMGAFSNQHMVFVSPNVPRVHLGSSASGYSANYQSNTINSYGSSGGTMDRGYDRQYMVSTSDAGIPDYDLPVAGTMHSGHSYSSSTLNTHYNYQVQNFKTVTMNKQGQFVMSNGLVGSVTPGAASDEVRVDCCLMTSDGRSVVTGSSLGPPQVWNMQNGELQNIMKGDSIGSTNLHLVCGDRLLVGAVHADMEINEYSGRKGVFNHTLQIWDFMTGRPLAMAEGEYCSAVCPMSDPDKVLFGRTDKYGDATSIIAWDLMGNQMIKEMRYDIPVGNNDYLSYLNISKNDRYIVAGFTNSFDNCAEFLTFDMTKTRNIINEPSVLKMDANVECTAILPKDEAVTGLRNGDLVIWSIQTGQPSRQLLGSGGAHAHTREVKSVTLSDDSRYLVSSSADGTLKVWDMHTERPIHNLQGHADEVWCSSISFDDEIVISGSADGTIRLWRMKNGTEMCVFNCGVNIFNVKMSRDKGTIVALGDKFGARKLIMLQVVRTKIKKIVSS